MRAGMRLAEATVTLPLAGPGARRRRPRRGDLGGIAARARGDRRRGRARRVPARRSSRPSRCAASSAIPRRSSPAAGVRWAAGASWAPGPNRLSANAAAMRMRARAAAVIVSGRAAPASVARLPVSALHGRLADPAADGPQAEDKLGEEITCVDSLERLGVRTLGELAELPAAAVADRFGEPGLRALRLARGVDEPLRPRRPHEEIVCGLGLPEAASGQQLERALELLIERLLAHPARAGEDDPPAAARGRVAGEGGWLSEVTMRNATAGAERLRLALEPKLTELPGPAAWLGLRALELGDPEGEQASLARSPSRNAASASARRCARRAPRRGATRSCERSRWTPSPASPSVARSSRRSARSGMARPHVYWPKPVAISATAEGVPGKVAGVAVEAVREEWLVEDRWWTPKPLQRRYFELVLTDGRNFVVFRRARRRRSLVRAASVSCT